MESLGTEAPALFWLSPKNVLIYVSYMDVFFMRPLQLGVILLVYA